MIDQITIDRILNTADLVEVVSEFVTLRKRGINYIGLCPFHNERTPSFSVSPAKGICKCFSCGKGGNVVHFIMEHEQMNYYEALRFLAKKYNIEIQERELSDEEKEARSIRESMFIVNGFALDYFHNALLQTNEGKSVGLAYLRKRGFRDDTISKFKLGYGLDQYDAFATEALSKGYDKEYLLKTGLCFPSNHNNQLLDRFRGRVIFPVHSISGKVVAFGGRILSSDNKKLAKYVNSPESEIYHKSNELYGIFFAKRAMVKEDCCYLVEGYTDVISMNQAGVENVVSSSGTALTPGQIRLIRRFTPNVTVLYDGDKAGIKASVRGIDMLLKEGMNVKAVLLPLGEDPDSFAQKHNSTEFRDYIKTNEVDFIRFKTNILIEDAADDPIKRAQLITEIVDSISVIPDAIVRSVYIKETSNLLRIGEKVLVSEVAKRKRKEVEKRFYDQKNSKEKKTEESQEAIADDYKSYIPEGVDKNSDFYILERMIMQLVVRYGEKVICIANNENNEETPVSLIAFIYNDLKIDDLNFRTPLHRKIMQEAIEKVSEDNFTAKKYFLAHPDPQISKLTADLISNRYQLSKYHTKGQTIVREEDRLLELVSTLTMHFKSEIVKEELKHMLLALQQPEIVNNKEECEQIMKRIQSLQQVQQLMAKKLGDRVFLI